MIANYGPIKPANLNANQDHLTAHWMPKASLEDLWKCICECQVFTAAGREAITNATAMHLTLTMFKNSGVFHSEVDKWKDKPIVQHTMANFQTHFKEDNNWHTELPTSTQAGFQWANDITTLTSANHNNDTDSIPHAAFTTTTIVNKSPVPNSGTIVFYC